MDWIFNANDPLWQTVAGSVIIFVVVIVFTRIIGLRSFAKFTTYDFAFTIAIGSIISTMLTTSTSLVHGSVAIASLLALTYIFSILQRRSSRLNNIISNAPLLLMDGSQILNKNLAHARIDKKQLIAKLREANVLNFDQVYAVVLESTGDISVLHGTNNTFDKELLLGVRKKP
jgi:uncharacterized membrane protein YcaP (DUF421 family)